MTGEHWLDRLASPHTRRQSFKAAVAGVALGLPLSRAATAAADNPNASSPTSCQRGCFYTTNRKTNRALGQCSTAGTVGDALATAFSGPLILLLGRGSNNSAFTRGCYDRAMLAGKASSWDCMQPNCPGFDPYGELGPCEPCAAVSGCLCCPSQVSSTGYDFCTSPPYCCGTAPGGFGCVPCGG